MSAVVSNEIFLPKQSVTTPIGPQQNSDVSYEAMTKGEMAEIAELRETLHQVSASVMLLSKLQAGEARTVHGNGFSAWGRTFVTIAVVLVGWIFTALYIAKTTETEIRVSNAILTEQLRETRENFNEYRKSTERDLKLADERFRQISIALESRGLKMPVQ